MDNKLSFLTDENISKSLLIALRKNKYNVKDIKEQGLSGVSDKGILDLAVKENRIILTHDKDFVNFHQLHSIKHKGIIILRFSNQSPKSVVEKFIPIINSKISEKFKRFLVIISDKHIEILKQ